MGDPRTREDTRAIGSPLPTSMPVASGSAREEPGFNGLRVAAAAVSVAAAALAPRSSSSIQLPLGWLPTHRTTSARLAAQVSATIIGLRANRASSSSDSNSEHLELIIDETRRVRRALLAPRGAAPLSARSASSSPRRDAGPEAAPFIVGSMNCCRWCQWAGRNKTRQNGRQGTNDPETRTDERPARHRRQLVR